MNKNVFSGRTFNLLKSAVNPKRNAPVLISITLILAATLYPFQPSIPNHFSWQLLSARFDNVTTFQDMVNNILLFIPLGCTGAIFLQRERINPIRNLLTVVIVSVILSSAIETAQVFLPTRTPTPADILNNTIGGLIGAICFHLYSLQSLRYLENLGANSSQRKATILWTGYVLLSFLFAINWLGGARLSNWSLNYPLIIGNEQSGNRPWHGYITEVDIADRAISRSEVAQLIDSKNLANMMGRNLVASYQFTGKEPYRDRTGQLPELSIQGTFSNSSQERGIALDNSHWLTTTTAVTALNKRISKSSQFTVFTSIASTDLNQTGPARIISISNSPFHRNFTISQQGNSLDLRLRTPMTGANATELKLSIPNIFVDNNNHYLLIAYSRGNLQVNIDSIDNFYSFNLWEKIPGGQQLLYYGQYFMPFGVLLFFLTFFTNSRPRIERLLMASGILLPSFIMEGMQVWYSGKDISPKNLVISILLTAGTLLALKLRLKVR